MGFRGQHVAYIRAKSNWNEAWNAFMLQLQVQKEIDIKKWNETRIAKGLNPIQIGRN